VLIPVREDRRHQTVMVVTLNIRARFEPYPKAPASRTSRGCFVPGPALREIVRIRHCAVKRLALANRVRRTVTLGVEVIDNRDIVVSHTEFGFSVTYRKDSDAPMLVAIDGIGRTTRPAEVDFWAQAWKAAHQKARSVGWLNS
jgi:hypothetical protein